MALGVSAAAFVFFKLFPDNTPPQAWMYAIPGWLSLTYITLQLWTLLDSALRVRPTSILDAILAIAPVVTGIVCFVLLAVGYLQLSWFQIDALAMLAATGVVEFVSTLWVRNVVLQRGVAVLPQGDGSHS
jgi:hypothetical protein